MSLCLTLVMVCSLSVPAFAANDIDYDTDETNPTSASTVVSYTGTSTEEYFITVPAALAPGGSGNVTVNGTWASNRKVTVSCDSNVILKSSIKSTDTKTLAVTFAGISLVGSNTTSVSETKPVSVAEISDVLFGSWSGTFSYTIGISNVSTGVNTVLPD